MEYSSYHVNVPQWREITVGSHLPAAVSYTHLTLPTTPYV